MKDKTAPSRKDAKLPPLTKEDIMLIRRVKARFPIDDAVRKNKIKFSCGGHSIGKPDYLTVQLDALSDQALTELSRAVKKGKKLDKPIILKGNCLNKCFICGEEPDLCIDGVSMRPEKPCAYPKGISLSFELNVPSGVMVVANDLRPEFKVLGDYDINTRMGCVKQSLAMAKQGCAHAFVGNTCPGVYKVGKDKFVIANPIYDEKRDKTVLPKNWEEVASICTDLWWYSIVDADKFKRRGLKFGEGIDKVNVRPGVYKFTHFRHLLDFDDSSGKKVIFSEVQWVRPPDPVIDYMGGFMKMSFTAGQVIYNHITQWPTLYKGANGIQRVADHIFCVNGGGGDWHPNGFVQYDPDMPANSPEVPIPQFDQPYHWYPLSEGYCALDRAATGKLNLNLSFAALAKNVLRCIIKHGSRSSRNKKEDRNSRKLAEKFLKNIDKLYPQVA